MPLLKRSPDTYAFFDRHFPEWRKSLQTQTFFDDTIASESFHYKLGGHYKTWENPDLNLQMDEFIQQHFIPNLKPQNTSTTLVHASILACGYMSFLFSVAVQNELEQDGLSQVLSWQLTNFALFRVDKLISDVLYALPPLGSNKQFPQELLSATGLLRVKLARLYERLMDGSLVPLWVGQIYYQSVNSRSSNIYTRAEKTLQFFLHVKV